MVERTSFFPIIQLLFSGNKLVGSAFKLRKKKQKENSHIKRKLRNILFIVLVIMLLLKCQCIEKRQC